MSRFLIEPEQIQGDVALITGEEAQHALRVLRLSVGDALTLLDGTGMEYEAVVEAADRNCLAARIVQSQRSLAEPNVRVTLYQGLCKADKMEWIVQKCVEAGIHRIVPIVTARCVARESGEQKQVRWQRIAREAAKQSGRGIVPQIGGILPLAEALPEIVSNEKVFLLWEQERERGINPQTAGERPQSAALIIGPEGGIAPEEAQSLLKAGASSFSLGRRILRTETAGLAALCALLCCWGEMEP